GLLAQEVEATRAGVAASALAVEREQMRHEGVGVRWQVTIAATGANDRRGGLCRRRHGPSGLLHAFQRRDQLAGRCVAVRSLGSDGLEHDLDQLWSEIAEARPLTWIGRCLARGWHRRFPRIPAGD